MTVQTCKGCVHRRKNANEINVYFCNYNPPQAIPTAGAGGALGFMTVYPPVNDSSIACSHYKGESEGRPKLAEIHHGSE